MVGKRHPGKRSLASGGGRKPGGPETRTSCVLGFGGPLFPDSRDIERDPPSPAWECLVHVPCCLTNLLEHRGKVLHGQDPLPKKHSVWYQESSWDGVPRLIH